MSRRLAALALVLGVLAEPLVARAATPAGVSSSAVTVTKDISRTHLVNGQDVVAESHTFSLTVSDTTDLRSLQLVNVSWTGAHPNTGNVSFDPNGAAGISSEYPVVLLECSGVDSPTPPAGQHQLDPTTCWTATVQERYVQSSLTNPWDSFPPWRLDRYATAAQRAAVAGQPTADQLGPGATQNCELTYNGLDPRTLKPISIWPPTQPYVGAWVPFNGGAGGTWYGGSNRCAGLPPEASGLQDSSSILPTNETWGASDGNGSGNARFDVWGSDVNGSLGCSATVACALVAVPILGISCDPAGDAASLPPEDIPPTGTVEDNAAAACMASGSIAPHPVGISPPTLAVDGQLWWAASNWRNRVSVPLSFAPPANVCNTVSNKPEISVYGSELMTEAAIQWAPHFCFGSTFKFKHVQTAEPEARAILNSGDIHAAFGSEPPGYAVTNQPVVNAPVAFTGFAISFSIDDANGHEVTSLKLTPRLLAKLLTESYQTSSIAGGIPELGSNPPNMALDPEFQSLNPGIVRPNVSTGVYPDQAASTLFALSTNSDVIQALTTYIEDDPDTKAWLDGAPDPWGMVVNPNYRTTAVDSQHPAKLALPTNSWPVLDTYVPTYTQNVNQCLFDTPQPFLPLVASPVSRLAYIAQDMEFAISSSQTQCVLNTLGGSAGEKLVAQGREQPGSRFVLGITSLAEAHRYALHAASLQTQVAPGTPAKFGSSDGRTFVAPTDGSLQAAAKLLSPDAATNSWPIPYDAIRTTAQGAGAYPGAMVVYADVPTSALPATEAPEYAELLQFAAGPGQTPGTGTGQLPPGYLPMTSANGLGALADYTLKAADAVKAQAGDVPPIVAPVPSPAPSAGGSSSPTPRGGGGTSSSASPSASPSASSSPTGGSSPGAGGNGGSTAIGPPIGGLSYKTVGGGTAPNPVQALGNALGQAAAEVGKTVAIVAHVATSLVLWLVYIGLGALAAAGAFYATTRRRGLKLSVRGLSAAIKEALLNMVARRRSPR